MIKSCDPTSFQKTETLLYNYNGLKSSVGEKLKYIEMLKTEGMDQKSKGITILPSNPQFDSRNEIEKRDDKVEKLYQSMEKTNEYLQVIDNALMKISKDPYFEIIRMKYFDEMTREDIACDLGVDVSTVTRNKNRLINSMRISLFSDDAMFEMIGVM